MQRFAAHVLALGGLCMGWWAPSPARAYEDQITLGLGAGYGHVIDGSEHWPGAAGELSASLGLGQTWAFRGYVGHSGHPGTPGAAITAGGVELLYLVDILEVVPYAGLGAGVMGGDAGGSDGAAASAHLTLGGDYLLSRKVALELDLRWAFVLPAFPASSRLTAMLAVVFLFDR